MQRPTPPPARGTLAQPPNRFGRITLERVDDHDDAAEPAPRTQFLRDVATGVISRNDSPDLPFRTSLNPYRGCEHGCIYCYARPTHEFLGYSAGLDFETRILVKERAPELLRAELAGARWEPQTLVLSGVTDPYQPVERRLRLTRRCLEVLAEFRNPVALITKNALVARDADVLAGLARHGAAAATVSLTSLDPALRRALEPRTAPPAARLAALRALTDAGVPAGVNVAPVIPGLNDHEIPALLAAARAAGAQWAGYTMLRLPHAVKELFTGWLRERFPERAEKVLARLHDVRGGALNDPRFGSRMRGEGRYAEQLRALFLVARRRAGFPDAGSKLSAAAFRRPGGVQLEFFGG
jgi:DNA repair photolyase